SADARRTDGPGHWRDGALLPAAGGKSTCRRRQSGQHCYVLGGTALRDRAAGSVAISPARPSCCRECSTGHHHPVRLRHPASMIHEFWALVSYGTSAQLPIFL